jgi:hypothetical protein
MEQGMYTAVDGASIHGVRPRRGRLRCLAWGTLYVMRALLVVALLAGTAHAEGERAASVGLGWATFSVPGKKMGNMEPPAVTPDVGGTLGFTYEHAISSDFSLRGDGAFGLFRGGATKDQSPTSYAGLVDAGVTFRFDVLKYVPYAFAGLGGVYSGGGPLDHGLEGVLVIGGGLDFLASRDRSYGLEARLASFGGDVTIFTLGLRATYRWGYF